MPLTQQQIDQFESEGFLLVENLLTPQSEDRSDRGLYECRVEVHRQGSQARL